MKVAIVHYWWITNRGGEAVVSELVKQFPHADIFTHVKVDSVVAEAISQTHQGKVFTTFISQLPFAQKLYQKYLPFMPFALESLDLNAYDLIISSESGPSKGVIVRPDALHICYCHSPMRYIWDMRLNYARPHNFFLRFVLSIIGHWLRIWDVSAAARVDYFIANSRFVAKRIEKYYRRTAEVIYPPVRVEQFRWNRPRSDFYLYLGQLTDYKRADLAVSAFNDLGLPLIVIGEGECFEYLRANSKANVKFLGRQPFEVVKDHLERCRGVVFPGVEDFGIVPVEAMAAGAPVIAINQGGAKETVLNNVTGILFDEQSVSSLKEAIVNLERNYFSFSPEKINEHAMKFNSDAFQKSINEFIERSSVNL